jgi:hypothetical protein
VLKFTLLKRWSGEKEEKKRFFDKKIGFFYRENEKFMF